MTYRYQISLHYNKDAGDVTPFQRHSETDFRDVIAFLMCALLHEKIHMLCQKMTLSDVLNLRITSSRTREIVVNNTCQGCTEEYISVGKEFHKFLLEYNVALRQEMEGDGSPCTSNFFRNTKAKDFSLGVGKDIAHFREKYWVKNEHE